MKRVDSLDDLMKATEQSWNLRLLRKKKLEEAKRNTWAVLERMDVSNFHELVPDMAFKVHATGFTVYLTRLPVSF